MWQFFFVGQLDLTDNHAQSNIQAIPFDKFVLFDVGKRPLEKTLRLGGSA